MVRNIAAVVVGLATGVLVILLVAMIGQTIAPIPYATGPGVPMSEASVGGLLFVLLAWALGALTGGWITARIAGGRWGPLAFVIAVLLVTSAYNMADAPRAAWFWIIGVISFPMAGWLGSRMAGGAPADGPVASA